MASKMHKKRIQSLIEFVQISQMQKSGQACISRYELSFFVDKLNSTYLRL